MSDQNSIGEEGIPPVPEDEERRLEALYRYDVLDGPRELTLDHITRLAARLMGTPLAVITLIDRHQQFVKACTDIISEPTDRDLSFCAHTIVSREPMVIPNALEDVRFRENPNVTGAPQIRYYAGAPLITPDGFHLGALCAVDTVPHEAPSDEDLELLQGLAKIVVDEFELRASSRHLQEQHEKLKQTQHTLDMALTASLTGVWQWEPVEDRVYLHPTTVRLLDLPSNHGVVTLADLRHHFLTEDQPRLMNALAEARHRDSLMVEEIRFEDRNGKRRWLEISAEPPGEGTQARESFVGIIHDITEQRQTAIGLRHLERLAAVGTLAAGVGHELNNPLTFVLAGVDYACQTLEQNKHRLAQVAPDLFQDFEEVQQGLHESREGAERIRDIVAELRRFGQPCTEELEPTDVLEALEFSLRMATSPIQSRARLVRDLEPLPPVTGTKTLLSQLFINLLVNAAQAIPPGNASDERITLRSRTLHEGTDQAKICIEITDTGTGIEPDVLPRIFDPFFTTKMPQEGTGLGLSTCLRIVRSLGGELDIFSAPDQGTRVRITLPVSEVPSTNALSASEVSKNGGPSDHKPRVLFIDDEPRIGEAFRRLTRRRFDAITTTRAEEALQWIEEGEEFAVIFSDLFMPDITGVEFYERLHESNPDLAKRVVLMTGGAFTDRARTLITEHHIPHIFKPFDLGKIEAVIEHISEGSSNLN